MKLEIHGIWTFFKSKLVGK